MNKYTADYLIRRRKEFWEEKHDIEFDSQLREAMSKELFANDNLRLEIIKQPEKLIELFFVIVDKNKKIVPFFLNEVQSHFINTLNHAIREHEEGRLARIRILILKGRQQGFTSLVTAYQLACSITRKNFEGYTLADVSSNAAAIFDNKAKFPKNQLPVLLKPTEQFNNKKQLKFSVLNSTWEVGTATKQVGRSRTVNFFHGSEAAFWEVPMSDIQAALGEALTKDCIEIYESTANGYNDYKEMWDSGVYINCFYEWWRTEEYIQGFESKSHERKFKKIIEEDTFIGQRIKWLREKKISWNQCYWYYKKWEGYIDKDKIKQEYPCTPEEAFLMSGRPVFDIQKIQLRIDHLREKYLNEPYREGFFYYEYEDAETKNKIIDSSIRFIESKEKNWIRIYEEPDPDKPYVVGGDTKGEGGDFYAATVIDNTTGKRTATLHVNLNNSEPYTHQMYCIGRYYNDALIGIEINFNTAPIEELTRLKYPRQYVRRKYDDYTKQRETKYGWKTDGNTRPLIIDKYAGLISENIDLINDIETLKEALTFVYDKNGRPDAMEGRHDDLLMSDMIANQIREQQSFKKKTEEAKRGHYTKDMLDDYNRASPEERKQIIKMWGRP